MTMDEALRWVGVVYAVLWFALVVEWAITDRDAWRVPRRDPVRERREHEELWR